MRAELTRAFDVMDHPDRLRPTRPVTRSGMQIVAGRRLQVNLASYAATDLMASARYGARC